MHYLTRLESNRSLQSEHVISQGRHRESLHKDDIKKSHKHKQPASDTNLETFPDHSIRGEPVFKHMVVIDNQIDLEPRSSEGSLSTASVGSNDSLQNRLVAQNQNPDEVQDQEEEQ